MAIDALMPALLGASLQEILHWYELREKLTLKKYKSLLNSRAYWIVTLLMTLSSALGTFYLLAGSSVGYLPRDYLIYSFVFPIILKKVAKLVAREDPEVNLGDVRGSKISDYLA